MIAKPEKSIAPFGTTVFLYYDPGKRLG